MPTFPRISGQTNSTIALDVTFYQNGIATDPYAIRRVDIFEGSEKPENLVSQIPIVLPDDPLYPSPVTQKMNGTTPLTGQYRLLFDVPSTFNAPSAYIDTWYFIGTDPGTGADLTDETIWSSQCNKFFIFPEGFYLDDGTVVPRLGFEALDKVFRKPERRTLEVGLMPLPLYDFDYNRIAPMIPQLVATITISTENCEDLVQDAPCRIGIRQGSFRTNPFVVQYTLDTSTFLIGTYRYRITLNLPNGETRISSDMRLTIV